MMNSATPGSGSPLSVAELTQRLTQALRTGFSSVWVTGEVSNYSRSSAGHAYLTLKDDAAQIRAVIWRGVHAQLPFEVTDGLEVIVEGSIDVYAARGQYQLTVRQVIPKGVGPLELAFRQLREKLEREGLFDLDRKRSIPAFPRTVALVTSPRGAAVRDFLEVAGRRWQGSPIIVVPCAVQGDQSVDEIVTALSHAGRLPGVDVVALVRGGGSLEDLASFNSERVARAIHESPLPVVSGVGHEVDLTIADLVADVRALTPSEAAERIFPDRTQLESSLATGTERMTVALLRGLDRRRRDLQSAEECRSLRFPLDRTREWTRRLDEMEEGILSGMVRRLHTGREQLSAAVGPLESLSPLASLARGYALVTRLDSPSLVRSAREIKEQEEILVRLAKGQLVARVEKVMTDD